MAGDMAEAWDAAEEMLKTPAQMGMETMTYDLHPGESAYVPSVAPAMIPFDEKEQFVYPPANGTFESTDEAVVKVDAHGLMTAGAAGSATVSYLTTEGEEHYTITVGEEVPTEGAKNVAYVAKREFLANRRARLPKYNQYAKWYYGKRNEIGWCAVFTIWCANAGGVLPVKKNAEVNITDNATLYFSEGQVGNQYDGFFAEGRFGSIPRIGYPVLYADMSNGYRTTHMGIVADVQDKGEGIYRITTVEGNMSNTVKSYTYLYDSNKANHLVGTEKGLKLQWNMSETDPDDREDPLPQYRLHTEHWSVFGFGESWK